MKAKRRAAPLWQPIDSLLSASPHLSTSQRRLLLIAVMAAVTAAIAAVVFFLPTYLVELDLGDRRIQELDEPGLLKAKNDVRTTLLQGLGGAFLFVGLYLTYRTIQVNREGQITERFTRAIDQLGNKELEVRVGGIFALERIARDSRDDQWPVMEVLTAFVREQSRVSEQVEQIQSASEDAVPEEGEDKLRADLEAAATVIARRNPRHDPGGRYLNLTGAKLPKANLQNAYLSQAGLDGANLQKAWLNWANLEEAALNEANLKGTWLFGANLQEAGFDGANLEGADLKGANLAAANLRGAWLHDANLKGASLMDADLRGADLSSARELTREQLEESITNEATKLPPLG